ncbi:MmcQ/YjbR family DNA-binding protein [Enterococcus malodoratus]|uniref:MmcQ/YjbR family DNA-binding protein n=1 Tax=Enterococcus malodoratus TaxID=71451 RepID=UPI00216510FE|nr:MmcQ/YjbR family DNA-binding protein [Enterococcus malodoratus]
MKKMNGMGVEPFMSREELFFKHKKINPAKLLAYGFEKNAEHYTYETTIMEDEFRLTVTIEDTGTIETKLVELASAEEYVLHRTSAAGSFVGSVKAEYQAVLQEIADQCFEADIFKNEQTKRVIDYVRETYQNELEFLWSKTPSNAIFRRTDGGKWYGALLTVQKNKLGLPSDDLIEVLDLRNEPQKIEALVDGVKHFPGYHMNKKHWFTICLDDSVSFEELKKLIDESYLLAVK